MSRNPKYKYEEAEKFILYHEEDNVLHTISVKLPNPPPLETIDGYGLEPKEQMFHRTEFPERLKQLERDPSISSIDDIWDVLNKRKKNYQEEIAFIEREWDRRLHGYWFFNHGVPTYIDGWHYFYLNYWPLDTGFPDYRNRDRKFFIFVRYAYTTTEAYYPIRIIDIKSKKVLGYFYDDKEAKSFMHDKGNERCMLETGDYIVDMGRRVCLGINYSKYRREGATFKAACINFEIISRLYKAQGAIQSMDGKHAEEAFGEKVVNPWKKVPFYFMPRYSGNTDPKKKLDFDIPAVRIGGKGSLINIESGLESFIFWAESAKAGAVDGKKLHFLNNDEIGKTTEEDVEYRHSVQRKCLMRGNTTTIFGLELNTSTVGEMSKAGGNNFLRLCNQSMWNERDGMGQTKSGLFNLFMPTYDGLDGYIDIYGESIIEDPRESEAWKWKNPVRDSLGRLMGSKRALEERITSLLTDDDPDSIRKYEEEMRQSPNQFNDCFITAGAGSGLNIKKISKQIRVLQFDKSATRQGNFEWENGLKDGRVVWIDDEINGRFKISFKWEGENERSQSNQKVQTTGYDLDGTEIDTWAPLKPWRFTAGADPYEFSQTKEKRHSKGAGAVFMERDRVLDYDGKPVMEWSTNRFVCTYLYRRLDPYDFAEDMLMMCVYYGAMMYPERNLPIIWNYFVKRGYGGYLKYTRSVDGKWDKSPGAFNRGAIPQKIMTLHQNYVENFIQLEKHIDILYQLKSIRGVNELTHYDLMVASGFCHIGSETDYGQFFNEQEMDDSSGIDLKQLYR